jgi:hypothetical protein
MAYEAEAVKYITRRLESIAQHVAEVVGVGPKREEWFNAESIVAIGRYSSTDTYVVYGEQDYRKAMEETPFRDLMDSKHKDRIPDVVSYSPVDGNKYDVPFIIEAKVIYRSESQTLRTSTLTKLRKQILRAKEICPSAGAIGLLYLVDLHQGTNIAEKDWLLGQVHKQVPKGTSIWNSQQFFKEIYNQVTELFADKGLTWLREPSVLERLSHRTTNCGFAVTVSVGLGAFSL